MNKLIKKIIPKRLLVWYRKIKSSKFGNMTTREIFKEIYITNHWKSMESISGSGSESTQTETLIKNLQKLLIDLNINSILDAPCGDFKWMQKVDLSKVNYIGADIVEEIINTNIAQYSKENINFQTLDLTVDPLPLSDLIITRDCFVHLSNKDIFNAIQNIKLSGCKYFLTTSFIENKSNYDIVTGNWRKLNLQKKPFNFPSPILIINENCTEGNGKYKDKSMVLWEISKI